jgi:FkbM family methyltransferase
MPFPWPRDKRRSSRRPAPHALARALFAFADACPDAFFIQVGSNDGRKFDPLVDEIASREWRGIMVEPVPYVFERLVRHHGSDPRLALENVAVASHDGTQTLYFLAEPSPGEELPEYYDALGSFRKDVVLKHRDVIPDIERRLVELEVPCLTFETLCNRHAVTRLDLVHIDTEGYDDVILESIDLDRWQPGVVLFEHYHMDPATYDACLRRVEGSGYETIANGMDTFCLRMTHPAAADRRLRRLWRRLRAEAGAPVPA